MIIKSKIWVAKYFTQGKCEEAVSEEKISFPELTEHHLRRMLITNIVLQLRLSEGLTQVNGLILITPSNVPKSSKWSELRLTCSGELFTFFVHTDSLCHQCRVWDIPAHSLLAFRRWVWPLQGRFISPGVRGPQDKCLYWSESLKCVSGEKLQWFVWPILGKRLQMRAIACWRCPFLSIDGKWDLSAWCRCRDLGAIRWDGSYPQ